MHCNGKCHLMKELAKSSESEKQQSQNDKKAFSPIELFCNTAIEVVIAPVFAIEETQTFYASYTSQAVGFDGSVFHPPILA